MAQVEVHNTKNEVVGKVKLASWWNVEIHDALIHQAVVAARAGARRGTASSKGRSEIRGGGAKPFRQKGTGRARQGTRSSPILRGGGTVFGPHPRDFSKKMNKRTSRQALQNALASKAAEKTLIVMETVELEEPKTRKLVEVMDQFEVISALVVVEEVTDILNRASSNLPWVKIVSVERINTYDVLAFEKLIIAKGALKQLEGVLA